MTDHSAGGSVIPLSLPNPPDTADRQTITKTLQGTFDLAVPLTWLEEYSLWCMIYWREDGRYVESF